MTKEKLYGRKIDSVNKGKDDSCRCSLRDDISPEWTSNETPPTERNGEGEMRRQKYLRK